MSAVDGWKKTGNPELFKLGPIKRMAERVNGSATAQFNASAKGPRLQAWAEHLLRLHLCCLLCSCVCVYGLGGGEEEGKGIIERLWADRV